MMGSQTARWTLLLRSSTSFGLIFSWSLQCMYYVVMLHILAIDASDATVFLHLVQCTELVHWLLLQANGGARILFDPDFRVFCLMVHGSSLEEWYKLNIDEARDGSNTQTNGSNLICLLIFNYIIVWYSWLLCLNMISKTFENALTNYSTKFFGQD